MAEIPEGTTRTKEVKHAKIKGERETGKGFQEVKSSGGAEKFQGPVDQFGYMQPRSSDLQRSKFGQSESATMTKEHIEEESLLKHVMHISKEIEHISFLATTETHPRQFSSLMEKLIMEQTQLVNFQQEMATSIIQRVTDRPLDRHTSDLHVLLSKIHLVSLKLKMQKIKSVDEAQVKTDTKLSEQQHDEMKEGHFRVQVTLDELGEVLVHENRYHPFALRKYGTKWYMTKSVYYYQHMLVDDLQATVPQTILVKEPVYQEQYMKNLNVLIKTQQQLVQNLTDLQKQKKVSTLEKESSEQDDLSAGEIGKRQLNELELITEQTDLIRCIYWVESHEEWQEYHFHYICMVMFSVYTVNCIHGRMNPGMGGWRYFMERLFHEFHMMTYGKKGKFVRYERKIMHSQMRFLDKAELWNKTQTSEERKHVIFPAGPLQDEEPDFEVLHSRMEDISVSDKEKEKTSIDLQESAEATSVSDVINKFHDEDSSTSASGYTPTTQTTQAVTLTTRTDEQAVKETHLQDVLNEFKKHTENVSDIEKTDILVQLPYMAVGYFNNNGGFLALEKYDVHLYIPHGAIAEGPPQQVYIYINPDATDAYTVNDKEEQLSPEVHCGPPRLKFKDSVVLSFPHHAESSDWKFTAKMSSASPPSPPAWQALNSSTGGQLVSAKGNKAIFLVNHFTGFSLFGSSIVGNRRKRMTVGAFGGIFDTRSYDFRVYVWQDTVSEKRVEDLEKKLRSQQLDTFRDLKFLKGKGNMHVEMTEAKEGWRVTPQTTQEIHEECVWSLPQNSVSFNVRIRGFSITDGNPIMAVNCFQQQEGGDWQGKKIRLSVGPKIEQMRNNNLIHADDAPLSIPAPCYTNRSGDNTLHSPMTEVTRAISSATMRPSGPDGKMYVGLSDQKVNKLCEFLDNQAAGSGLLDYLSGEEYISPISTPRDVLTKYFKLCSKHNIPDQGAIHYLKLVFHELNYTGAAEIIEPGGQIADAEVEPLLPFLDKSLDQDAEIYFRKLAAKLGEEWECLATCLGISHSRLYKVKLENLLSVTNQIFCMLVIWQEGFESSGEDAFKTLSSALETIGRIDLAGFLKRKVTSMMFFKRRSNRIL